MQIGDYEICRFFDYKIDLDRDMSVEARSEELERGKRETKNNLRKKTTNLSVSVGLIL